MSCACCCNAAFGSGRAPPPTSRDLIFTAVQTGNFNAAVGDYVQYDPTGTAGFTITFPANPSKDDRIGAKNVSESLVNVSIAGGGNTVESPDNFGDSAATVPVTKNGVGIIWQFDGVDFWKIV